SPRAGVILTLITRRSNGIGLVPARGGDPSTYISISNGTRSLPRAGDPTPASWPIAFCDRRFKTVWMKVDRPCAKTAPNGETCSLVNLCHHVVFMAGQLMASSVLRSRLAAAFQTDLTERHLDRLAILAGIHDLGKALKGFQDKLEGTPLTSRGHVAEALAALSHEARLKTAVQLPLFSEWFERVSDALYVSICHHGEPVADDRIRLHLPVLEQLLARTRYGHDPITEIGKLSDFLIAQFPNATKPAPKLLFTPAAQHLFAGIL